MFSMEVVNYKNPPTSILFLIEAFYKFVLICTIKLNTTLVLDTAFRINTFQKVLKIEPSIILR